MAATPRMMPMMIMVVGSVTKGQTVAPSTTTTAQAKYTSNSGRRHANSKGRARSSCGPTRPRRVYEYSRAGKFGLKRRGFEAKFPEREI